MNEDKFIENIYKNSGYFTKYGGSFVSMLLLLVVFFVIVSYFRVMRMSHQIKSNWNENKCKPSVIPFAGFINKSPGQGTFDYTSENFSYCLNNILTNISNDFIAPIHYALQTLNSALSGVGNDVNFIRTKITDFTKNFASIDSEIMKNSFKIIKPLQYSLLKMKSVMKKTSATFMTGVFTFFPFLSMLLNILDTLKKVATAAIIIIAALIATLIIVSIIFPGAAVALGLFIALSATLGAMIGYLDVKVSEIQKIAMHCFDENTILSLKNGRNILIKNVKIGDELHDGSIVTSKLKLSSKNVPMYNYNDIQVSGNHSVFKSNMWYKVEELPEAELIMNYRKRHIYCLNTNSKILKINDIIFSDYDELEEQEIYKLRDRLNLSKLDKFTKKHIHKHLDGGFVWNTKMEMEDGFIKNISELKVNDILKNGSVVTGIVEIDAHDLEINVYQVDNKYFKCSKNLFIDDPELGVIELLITEPLEGYYKNSKKIYNILTNTGKFIVNNVQFMDYKYCLEKYLD